MEGLENNLSNTNDDYLKKVIVKLGDSGVKPNLGPSGIAWRFYPSTIFPTYGAGGVKI